MKKQTRINANGSHSAAAPQSKTTQSRAHVRPTSATPFIALYPEGEGEYASEEVYLSEAECAALKRAFGDGILKFMVNTALKKIGWSVSSSPARGGLTFILQEADGREWGRTEFNSSERRRIEAAAKTARLALPEFFEKALLNRLASMETEVAGES